VVEFVVEKAVVEQPAEHRLVNPSGRAPAI
jgi:hypothetical protein